MISEIRLTKNSQIEEVFLQARDIWKSKLLHLDQSLIPMHDCIQNSTFGLQEPIGIVIDQKHTE